MQLIVSAIIPVRKMNQPHCTLLVTFQVQTKDTIRDNIPLLVPQWENSQELHSAQQTQNSTFVTCMALIE